MADRVQVITSVRDSIQSIWDQADCLRKLLYVTIQIFSSHGLELDNIRTKQYGENSF